MLTTVPSDPTVATDVLLEVHVTLVLVALLGETVNAYANFFQCNPKGYSGEFFSRK